MSEARSTGVRLGRAAAALWRQRTRAQQSPVAPVAARLGRAAGAFVGRQQPVPASEPGTMATALRHGGRRLWARAANVLTWLGLQVAAVLFLFFALGFGAAGVKGWLADNAHKGIPLSGSITAMSRSTQLELGLALVFAYFSISSWFRAAARRS